MSVLRPFTCFIHSVLTAVFQRALLHVLNETNREIPSRDSIAQAATAKLVEMQLVGVLCTMTCTNFCLRWQSYLVFSGRLEVGKASNSMIEQKNLERTL